MSCAAYGPLIRTIVTSSSILSCIWLPRALRSPVVIADGAGAPVHTPYRGRGSPASQKDANRANVQMPFPAERAQRVAQDLAHRRKLPGASGAPGNSPRPSTSFEPARSPDDKGSLIVGVVGYSNGYHDDE
jgi:hypothetical protein